MASQLALFEEKPLTVERRVKLLEKEWERHKFREGEYFDRYLYKLLKKYDLSLEEYYKYH